MGGAMCHQTHHCEVEKVAHAIDSTWPFHFRSKSGRETSVHGGKDAVADTQHKERFRSYSVTHRGDQHHKRHKHFFGTNRSFGRRARVEEAPFRSGFHFLYRIDLRASCPHGQYAAVAPAIDLQTSKNVAVKIISKLKLSKSPGSPGENVKVEVQALRTLLGQPNVVQFIDAFEDGDFFYIVMEYLEGGTLLDYVKAAGHLGEEKTANLLHQMLNIVNICHKEGISHRDLKLENFLFSHVGEDHSLKLVDFGSAGFFKSGESNPFKDSVGTPFYMAPEVLSGVCYGPPADVWSLGVIAYSVLCGHFPFCASNKELKDLILYKPVEFSSASWESVSDGAKDMLQKMLDKDPQRRILASQAILHPWVQKHRQSTCAR